MPPPQAGKHPLEAPGETNDPSWMQLTLPLLKEWKKEIHSIARALVSGCLGQNPIASNKLGELFRKSFLRMALRAHNENDWAADTTESLLTHLHLGSSPDRRVELFHKTGAPPKVPSPLRVWIDNLFPFSLYKHIFRSAHDYLKWRKKHEVIRHKESPASDTPADPLLAQPTPSAAKDNPVHEQVYFKLLESVAARWYRENISDEERKFLDVLRATNDYEQAADSIGITVDQAYQLKHRLKQRFLQWIKDTGWRVSL